MIREVDVPVTVRDGKKLYVNVYRPEGAGPVPVVMSASWYGKDRFGPDKYQSWAKRTGFDVGRMTISQYTPFEAPDPAFWVPHGYAVVHIDIRGMFKSEGDVALNSPQDALDYYDVIEWAARQPWSTGQVGLSGVSYLALSQWYVAALRPPHLKAIIPWEGLSDHYRDNAFHGGIPETAFRIADYSTGLDANRNLRYGVAVDYPAMLKQHPLFDDVWRSRAAQLERIKVPALVAAAWSDQGNHTRGSFEGFKRISSPQKWLYTHGRYEWPTYYGEESKALQLKFFDHFLKGAANGMESVPRVRLEIRKSRQEYEVQYADAWPVRDTHYRKLFLDAASRSLIQKATQSTSSVSYSSDTGGSVSFDHQFAEDTRLVGNMKLRLWVSAAQADDMDLFVGIRKLNAHGDEVHFIGFGGNPNDIVTRGWLRVSARETDPRRSKPWQPYLQHRRSQKLAPGEVVPVDIEILPSGTLFEKGSTLRLVVQGKDIVDSAVLRHDSPVNRGPNTLHTGGHFDSYLLVPEIPAGRHHSVIIGGSRVEYDAALDTFEVSEPGHHPGGTVTAISYIRSGERSSANPRRPVIFAFNGGPSVPSIFLHAGLLGPERIDIPADVHASLPVRFPLVPNGDSILDTADLVLLDPVDTGFSRLTDEGASRYFYSVKGDAEVLANVIATWLVGHGRAGSPVYIVGESYGATRAVEVANQLLRKPDVAANVDGLVLLSQSLVIIDTVQRRSNTVGQAVGLETIAATAWYHKLAGSGQPLEQFVQRAQAFATQQWLPALFAGSSVDEATRRRVAQGLASFTGLPEDYFTRHDLYLSKEEYRRLALGGEGLLLGASDTRYTGPLRAGGDPSQGLQDALEASAPDLLRSQLGIEAGNEYHLKARAPDWIYLRPPFDTTEADDYGQLDYAAHLLSAMARKPDLRVFVAGGWFDTRASVGADDYLVTRRGLDLKRVTSRHYAGGHMFYTEARSRAAFAKDLRDFIKARAAACCQTGTSR